MKLFRRISALALVLALVCAFSASAFAATSEPFEDEVDYGNNEKLIVYAEINRYDTTGEIFHGTYDSAENYSSISVTYTYYQDANGTRVTLSDSEVTNGADYCSITKGISQSYFAMISAAYTFQAQVSAQTGSYSYGPVAATLYY